MRAYNNKQYNYRYIIVVDDKGYDGLYKFQSDTLVGSYNSNLPDSLLMYNFEYLVEEVIGRIPYGTVINWTLGNIFTVLSSQPVNSVTSSGKLYRVEHNSVTKMTYYFVYNSGWRMVGVSGDTTVKRVDRLTGNVNGTPVNATVDAVKISIYSPESWYSFIDSYLSVMSWNPNYMMVSRLGKLKYSPYQSNTVLNFEPVYAENPSDL